ncbi:hypothetical protein DFH09DRAFT_1194110 [Mycena vulgaris]|nr:hypothetical protein DFH09DRAFT_1194110 [Mycena vulgaris]
MRRGIQSTASRSCLTLLLFTTLVDITGAQSCPPFDTAGNSLLTDNLGSTGLFLCEYETGPEEAISCAFFPNNGTLDVDIIEDKTCPEALLGGPTSGTSADSPTPTPAPATTASSHSTSSSSLPPNTHSSPGTTSVTSTSSQPVSPPPTSAATGAQRSNKQSVVRTTIAGSVVGVCLLLGIVILALWLRHRRRRRDNSIRSQYVVGIDPSDTLSVATPSYQPDPRRDSTIQRQYADEIHPFDTLAVSAASYQSVSQRSSEKGRTPASDAELGSRGDSEGDETIADRLRRVEAQLAAMVSTVGTESSPPSYYAESNVR